MSVFYGEKAEIDGLTLYKFPSYTDIFDKGEETLKQFKLGFRTRFVFSAAKNFVERDIENSDMHYVDEELLHITGIGSKVLDCIKLYGLHDLSSFPIDVWIKRAILNTYGNMVNDKQNYKKMRDIMVGYFGRYSGYAQVYLYNYFRLNKLR